MMINNSTAKTRHASERSRRKRMVEECVEKYKEHFSFLRDSKFLQDLENDSVDSDIIEEELSALHETPISIREKVVKFLQSNPFQILLCVIVLLDAGIVIAQILLDLNSVKDKLHRREVQLFQLIGHIKRTQAAKLCGYPGFDVDRILRLIGDDSSGTNCTSPNPSGNRTTQELKKSSANTADPSINWTIDSVADYSPAVHSSQGTVEGLGGISGHTESQLDIEEFRAEMEQEHDVLHEVAHCLHFASIAMLGFLVVEVLVKIVAMGKNFCKHKIEIFDAKIIIASFAIDIIFLGGVSGEEGPKAAAVLVILLLWRIARVVDGIVVTVKQRQEFRIRLQKRARRTAERKMENFEEERHAKTKQIEALKDLCTKAGITDADIAACAPRHQRQVNTTLCALSSVARLSVSMTMLMSSGIYRPRLTDDGLILPKVFGPKTKDQSLHHHNRNHQKSQHVQNLQIEGSIPRIESLPIIQNSSSSSSLRGKQRNMAFTKSGRKQHGAFAEGFKSCHQPVIEAGEDAGGSQMTTESAPESSNQNAVSMTTMDTPRSTDRPTDSPLGSPVNSSGVHILIDGSSDIEGEDPSLASPPAASSNDDTHAASTPASNPAIDGKNISGRSYTNNNTRNETDAKVYQTQAEVETMIDETLASGEIPRKELEHQSPANDSAQLTENTRYSGQGFVAATATPDCNSPSAQIKNATDHRLT